MNVELRYQILRAITQDHAFLKTGHHYVDPEMFPEPEEQVIAQVSLDFYKNHDEPIGALLSSDAEDLAGKKKLGLQKKKQLQDLVNKLQNGKMQLVSVKALLERTETLRRKAFFDRALDGMIGAYEKDELTVQTLEDFVQKAGKELHVNGFDTSQYFDEIDKRIVRRKTGENYKRYPLSFMAPLDDNIHLIERGQLAFFLAPANSGKGLALIQIEIALMMQGFNCLHFTLEDPVALVEDRIDAALAGLPMSKLAKKPKTVRERFERFRDTFRGRLKIIDCTDGGWTVSKFEKVWEQERQNGFVADGVIIDYDDEIEAEKQYKGDRIRLMEFNEIYKSLRRMAAKLNIFLWTAAQATRAAEGKSIITGKDVAEDYGKIRKAFLAISIGCNRDKDTKQPIDSLLNLHVIRHRTDRNHGTYKIKCDFASGLLYDAEETAKYCRIEKLKAMTQKKVKP